MSVLVCGAMLGCEGRARTTEPDPSALGPAVAEFNLRAGAPESPPASLFGPTPASSFADLLFALEELGEEDRAVLINLGSAGLSLAQAEEAGRAFEAVRADKTVACHADQLTNATLLFAARACSEIWVSPQGRINTVGLAAQFLFARSFLERFHVDADFLQVGDYKGASEMYLRDSLSEEARSSWTGTLGSMRTAWLDGISQGRAMPGLKAQLEDGPLTPSVAKDRGMIDHIGTIDDARKSLMDASDVDGVRPVFGNGALPKQSGGLVDIFRALGAGEGSSAAHVAVVRASGAITSGAAGGLFSEGGISEQALLPLLRELKNDEGVKAVVLRIDSPGGSALASDNLWVALMELREQKPLVVSVGSMAASGGYYMACAGDEILAEATSIIGSVGVVVGKLSFGGALSELGVSTEVVAASPDPEHQARATYLSPFTTWDDATRDQVLFAAKDTYDIFVDRITTGRGAPASAFEGSLEGRLFGGEEAKSRGLIDEIGGLGDAIVRARDRASLGDDVPVKLWETGTTGLFGSLAPQPVSELPSLSRLSRDAAAHEVLGRLPAGARDFLSALSPLVEGEQVVATQPFALIVQ